MFPDLVVPPVTDTGQHGVAEITFNNDDTAATVRVETNLKGSDITNVYLRFGGPGENGLVLFSLNAGNLSTFSRTIKPEDIVDYGTGYNWDSFRASLKRQEIYILIQTNQVLDGELRGDFK